MEEQTEDQLRNARFRKKLAAKPINFDNADSIDEFNRERTARSQEIQEMLKAEDERRKQARAEQPSPAPKVEIPQPSPESQAFAASGALIEKKAEFTELSARLTALQQEISRLEAQQEAEIQKTMETIPAMDAEPQREAEIEAARKTIGEANPTL